MNIVKQHAIVKTNYGSGPYIIKRVSGPCICAQYLDQITPSTWVDGKPKPSEPHYHMVCQCVRGRDGDFYLSGFRLDGTNVWNDDELELIGYVPGQLDLLSSLSEKEAA
jgi:hypothetical protein